MNDKPDIIKAFEAGEGFEHIDELLAESASLEAELDECLEDTENFINEFSYI